MASTLSYGARIAQGAMTIVTKALLVSLGCFVTSGIAQAQVEWFTKNREVEKGYPFASYLYTKAYAGFGTEHRQQSACAEANLPRVRFGAWKQMQDECGLEVLPLDLSQRESYVLEKTVSVAAARGDRLESAASQTATFTPTSLRLTAKASTTFTGVRGRSSMRGIPRAGAQIYFRIPDGPSQFFRFKATMRWTGTGTEDVVWNRGGFQLSWVPNTITGEQLTDHFSGAEYFDYSKSSSGQKPAERTGELSPGVYWLMWDVSNDMPDKTTEFEIKIELDFRLEKHCLQALGNATADHVVDEGPRLFGPYATVKDAALVAGSAVFKEIGLSPTLRERGLLVLRDRQAPHQYYFVKPVRGSLDTSDSKELAARAWEAAKNLVYPVVTWKDYIRGRDDAFLHSCRSNADFDIAATAHLHPAPGDQDFSSSDFNQAVQLWKDKANYPKFEQIILFTATGECVRGFEPKDGDVLLKSDDDPRIEAYRRRTNTFACR